MTATLVTLWTLFVDFFPHTGCSHLWINQLSMQQETREHSVILSCPRCVCVLALMQEQPYRAEAHLLTLPGPRKCTVEAHKQHDYVNKKISDVWLSFSGLGLGFGNNWSHLVLNRC